MFTIGVVLTCAKISIMNWQFWAILVPVMAYGIIQNAEGYKEGAGHWSWE